MIVRGSHTTWEFHESNKAISMDEFAFHLRTCKQLPPRKPSQAWVGRRDLGPLGQDFRPTKISFVNLCSDVAELRWVDEQGTEHDKASA